PASRSEIDTRILVETPEGVDFRFQLAGPGKRVGAYFADLAIRFGILALLVIILIIVAAFTSVTFLDDLAGGMILGSLAVAMFLLDWFYPIVFEALWNGQTPGKRLMSLRVVRGNGTPIEFVAAAGRGLLRAADFLPFGYLVAMISMMSTRRFQRLGDLFFDTMVIDESREFISRAAGVTHGIDAIHRSECTGKYNVPERTLAIIERLFENDRLISPARREEIAAPLAISLRKRLGFIEPQPERRNPHTYFQTHAYRHTLFLRRVLATFVDKITPRNPNDPETVSPDAFAPPPFPGTLQQQAWTTTGTMPAASSESRATGAETVSSVATAPVRPVAAARNSASRAADSARQMSLDALFDEWQNEGKESADDPGSDSP
ncbi:MAG: RDD family protein, partial [Planctomycetaceae bacterium]|nr:RDD family protein [Planctomycetaceae bacterium]